MVSEMAYIVAVFACEDHCRQRDIGVANETVVTNLDTIFPMLSARTRSPEVPEE